MKGMTHTLEKSSWARFSKRFIAVYVVEILITSTFVGMFGFVPDMTTTVSAEEDYDMTNVVAMWKMDEDGGDTVYDETDNDNDGTIYDADWAEGKNNSGLSFDGDDDYVEVPDDSSFDLPNGTLEIWFNPAQLDGHNCMIVKNIKGSSPTGDVEFEVYDSKLWLCLGEGTGNEIVLKSNATLISDKWYHSAFTWGSFGVRLYLAGKLENQTSRHPDSVFSSDTPLWVGRWNDNINNFKGTIDEVVLHDKALSPSEFYGMKFMPDLKVEESGIQFSTDPVVGKPVLVNVTVENVGYAGIEHWQITKEDYDQAAPSFSPDGGKIAYTSNEDGGSYSDVWVMNNDGTNRIQLNNPSGNSMRPNYTPNSSYIYYMLQTPTWDIYRMEPDGDNEEEIIGGSSEQVVGDISPDGTELVYQIQGNDIWLANANGSGERKLTTDGENRNYPSFNAEGSKIVYWSNEDGGSYQDIWTLTKNGNEWDSTCTRQQITFEDYQQEDVYFTPSGDKIIYDSQEGGSGVDDIWIIDSNGENHIQLTKENYRQSSPCMSNDGSRVLYASYEDGGSYYDIWQLNATATATVSFYDGDPDNGGTLIGTDEIAVWANATVKAEVEWTPRTGGERDIYVVVDGVEPGDANKSNNVASKTVEVVDNGVWLRMDEEPSDRAWPGMVYDSVNKKVVLFGGTNESNYKDDTWVYDVASNIWTTMNPSTKPSARERVVMVYDSSNNLIMLYGGCIGSNQFVDDTWVYDVATNTWTEKNPLNHPNVEVEYGMAYDSANKVVVLFGGYDGDSERFLNETWVYDVTADTWTQKNPSTKPTVRGYFSMAYDSVNEKIVLFGGYLGDGDYSDETWLYDLKEDKWTQKNPTKKPSARSNHRMTYDSAINKVVLFGGQDDSNNDLDDTWLYDVVSNTWTQKNPLIKPSARRVPGMAYDSANNKIALFGGVTAEGANNHDTWLYDYATNNWTQAGQVEKPDKRNMHAMAYDSKNEVTVMFGGALEDGSLNDETWLYYPSNNTWSQKELTKHPSERSDFSMVYNSIDGKSYLFGGGTDSGLSDETWAYDSSTNIWEDLNPTSKPSARQNYAMAYDSDTNKIVLFGGNIQGDIIDDTWVYDVSSNDWEEIEISGDKPSKRTVHGMAYDPVHKKVILFGGYDDDYDNETWVYDVEEETWERKYPTVSPPPTCYINLVYNPNIKKTMFFGGRNEGDLVYSNEIWIYDFSINNWTKVNPKNKPHERARDPMVYDDDNNQLIVFGGYYNDGGDNHLGDTWTYSFHTPPTPKPSLTLTTSASSYHPGDTVTVEGLYTGADETMDFGLRYPDGSILQEETVRTKPVSEYLFRENLAAWWDFDDGEGQVAADLSGNGNDGTLGNSSGEDDSDPAWVDGISGKALRFDGTDDYVDCGTDTVFDLGYGVTFSAWIKKEAGGGFGGNGFDGIIATDEIYGESGYTGYNFGLHRIENDKYVFGIEYGDGAGERKSLKTESGTIDTKLWYHVVGVCKGSNDMSLYLNGEAVAGSYSGSGGEIDWNENSCIIGVSWATYHFKGSIDDVRIYNTALTADEVAVLYQLHSGKANLSAAWDFDEGYGQALHDLTGNGLDGTLGVSVDKDSKDPDWIQGLEGTALNFNEDYTDFGDIDIPGTGTVNLWFRPDIDYDGDQPDTGKLWYKRHSIDMDFQSDSTLRTHVDGSVYLFSKPRTYHAGVWYHVAWSWGADGTHLYINGTEEDSDPSTDTAPDSAKPFVMGAATDASDDYVQFFLGTMDLYQLHSRALSASEVAALYHRHSWKLDQLAHWDLEEGEGQETEDVTGNGHDGTLGDSGDEDDHDPVWVEGISGKALEFDGVDDFVSAADPATLKLTNDFSISFWFNTDAIQQDGGGKGMVFMANTADGSFGAYSGFAIDGDGIASDSWWDGIRIWKATGASSLQDIEYVGGHDGQWHQVTVIFSSTEGMMLYVDGFLEVQRSGYTDDVRYDSTTPYLLFGAENNDGSIYHYYEGKLDEALIHSTPLNASAVRAMYQATLSNYRSAIFDHTLSTNAPTGTYTARAGTMDAAAEIGFEVLPLPDIKLSTDNASYEPGENVTVDALYTGTDDTMDFELRYPNGTTLHEETVRTKPASEYLFGDDLVAWWDFDEGEGDVAADLSGKGNHGDINDASWTQGVSGAALDFDGDGDHVALGMEDFQPDEYGFLFWFNADTIPATIDNSYLLTKDANAEDHDMAIQVYNDTLRFHVDDGSTTAILTTAIVENTWYHVGGTYDGSDLKLYLNGELKNSTTHSGLRIASPGNNYILGAQKNTPQDFFDGIIDETRFYARALTADEIAALYQLHSDKAHIAAHWNFAEGKGQLAEDSSGNDNDATLGDSTNRENYDPTWVEGISGTALEFDGYEEFLISQEFAGSPEYSYSAWIKLEGSRPIDENGGDMNIIFHQQDGVTSGVGKSNAGLYLHDVSNGDGIANADSLEWTVYSSSDHARLNYEFDFLDDSYHHVVGTATKDSIAVYIDGELAKEMAIAIGDLSTSSYPVFIGDVDGGSGRDGKEMPFYGIIDEPMIYSKALTADEVAALYHQHSWKVNLSAAWDFDEGTDQRASDSSGNDNAGTLGDSQASDDDDPLWVNGLSGKGLRLDGDDDHVLVPHDDSLTSTEITVEAWIYPYSWSTSSRGSNDADYIVCKGDSEDLGSYWIAREGQGSVEGKFQFSIRNEERAHPAKTIKAWSNKAYSETGRWYHLVGVCNESELMLYVDGELVGSAQINDTLPSNTQDLKIGWYGVTDFEYAFDGIMDEVRLYSRALSAGEVASHYDLYSRKLNQTAHWSFDEGEGQTAMDGTWNGHNGTLGDSAGEDDSDPVWVDGIFRKALEFDGIDDYLKTEEFTGSPAFSYSTWVKVKGPTIENRDHAIIFHQRESGVGGPGKSNAVLHFWGPPGHYYAEQIRFSVYSDSEQVDVTYDYNFTDNTFHHIVATATKDSIALYLDGKLVNQRSIDIGELSTSIYPAFIGDADSSSGHPGLDSALNGTIDELRIFSRALNASEIISMYLATMANYHLARTSFTLPTNAPAGTYTVLANTTDAAANLSFEVEGPGKPIAVIDTITPNPAILGEDITFTGHGTDDGTIQGYAWSSSMDGEFYNGSESTFDYAGLSLGTHTISLRVVDDLGFWSDVVTTTLAITTRPVAVIDHVTPSPALLGRTVTFFFNGTDDGTVERFSWSSNIDGEFYNDTGNSFTTNTLSQGQHTLTLKVVDDLGFWSEEAEAELTVSRRPVAIIDSITPGFANPGTEVKFNGSGTGDSPIEHYSWRSSINGEIYDGTDNSFERDDLSLGLHTIFLRVMDENSFWSSEVSAELNITEPALRFTNVGLPDTASTGHYFSVLVDVHSSFDSQQSVILALQLENPENEPLDPEIEIVVIQPDETIQETLTLRIDESEPPGRYSLQVQAYLKLPRDEGFALDFQDFEMDVSAGGTRSSISLPTTTRAFARGETTFSLETDKDELRPGEELTVYANLSEVDFPEGSAVSFEILDPVMKLKYTRSFVTDGDRRVWFTIKTRDNYGTGDYIIYATAPFGNGTATAETGFKLVTPLRIGKLLFELGDVTAYRKEGAVPLDMGDGIQNFDILQTGEQSFALLIVSSDLNPELVPWEGDLYLFMGPKTTIGLFIFNGHFYLWVSEGFVFIYTALDNPDDDWSSYLSAGVRADPGPLPLHITSQQLSIIEEGFPGEDYKLAMDIQDLRGDLFFQLNVTEEYDYVSMYKGLAGLSDDRDTVQLAQGGEAALSDAGMAQANVRAAYIVNQGSVNMTIDEDDIERVSSRYHIPINETLSIDILPEGYSFDEGFLDYILTGTGEGLSPYTSSTTILENNITRSWSWSSTVVEDEKDGYRIIDSSEMTMTPGSTKNYTLQIQENANGESRSFVIRNMPGYEEKGSSYSVNDWENLDDKDEQPVDYTHDGTRIGVSSDEEAAEVIERWLEEHEKDVPDPNDQDSWLYDSYYGFPLYIYLVAIVLLMGMTIAYRKGKRTGKEEGKFYSRVEERQKMKEVEKDTLQSLSKSPGTGTQPETLSGTKLAGPGSFAPPSLNRTDLTSSAEPLRGSRGHPTIDTGTLVPQGNWKCQSCGFVVDVKFSFCTKCGTRRNT